MFSVLSILGFLLTPSNIMVGLGLAGVALLAIGRSHMGRCMLVVSVMLIAAAGVLPIGAGLALPLESRFPHWEGNGAPPTGVIVLGGGVIKPGISADRRQVVVGNTADRIVAAVALARRYPSTYVVFVGTGEANFAIRFFENLGVPRDRVIVEGKSRNTAENAVFARQLVMPKLGDHWLLVTSAMHMPRAIGAFRRVGFAVDAYPVDYETASTQRPWELSPSLMGGIGILDRAVHEWAGLLVYWITGRISEPFPGPM